MKKVRLDRYLRIPFFFSLVLSFIMAMGVGTLYAEDCSTGNPPMTTIGGNTYTGSSLVLPDGSKIPNYDTAAPLSGASIMVQTMFSGGKFVTYGTASGSNWTAQVPDPGQCDKPYNEYIIMFTAPGHDVTSREYPMGDPVLAAAQDQMSIDAYLPPAPLPEANLLVYAFYDNYINAEDDAPDDPPLNGVKFTARDEDGNFLAEGYSGSQPRFFSGTDAEPLRMADGNVLGSADGFYYFEGLPPGEVIVSADPSDVYRFQNPRVAAVNAVPAGRRDAWPFQATDEFYQISTEEGGHTWDPKLYPGDPGTFAGIYMTWHGFVKKLGPITPTFSPIVGTINGTCEDADPAIAIDAIGEALLWPISPGVTANKIVPNCVVILFNNDENIGIHPVATTEAGPDGKFHFSYVPPGKYKLFITDKDLKYVWQQAQINVWPGLVYNVPLILVPRFYGRAQGYVRDTAGNPIPNAKVNLRYKSGTIKKVEYTDATGWYNFDSLPEIEVLGHVDVDLEYLAANGYDNYRGFIGTTTFYPDFNGVGYPNADPNNFGEHIMIFMPQDLGTPNPVLHNQMNRYIAWLTANYRADLTVEAVPAGVGQIHGNVFIDTYATPQTATQPWDSDGLYHSDEERTLHGARIELYSVDPVTQALTLMTGPGFDNITSGKVSESFLRSEQGWTGAYDYSPTPNEWGGVWVGPAIGYYEFRDVPPGDYVVKIVMPAGFEAAPVATDASIDYASIPVTVSGGDAVYQNIGVRNSQPVPQAGEVEGGVFDDVNIDFRTYSLLRWEKAGIPKIPVGIYDHLGYFMGSGVMGNPMCYANAPAEISDATGRSIYCPADEAIAQKPEVERRAAPGVHIYRGNDPVLYGHNHCYDPLDMPYTFGPGGYKFEADWSLVPSAMNPIVINPVNCYLDNQDTLQSILPPEAPVGTHHTPGILGPGAELKKSSTAEIKMAGGGLIDQTAKVIFAAPRQPPQPAPTVMTIHGSNFGDEQAYSTVSIGGIELKVVSWSDTDIVVKTPTAPNFPIGLPAIVATSTGITTIPVDIDYDAGWKRYIERRTVYVAAGTTGGNGSKTNPYGTITEALNNLPSAKPRYVVVGPGVYNERIHIQESDIRLIGSGPVETVINARSSAISVRYTGVRGTGPTIYIGKGGMTGSVNNIMISGFSIRGGSTKDEIGGGVFGDYGNRNIDINNSIIGLNGGYYGGGIWLHYSNHDVKIWSNVITQNGNYGGYGGGISVNDEPEYIHNETYPGFDHSPDDNNPGPPPGTYRVYNNLIYHNWSADYGGGMCFYELKDHLIIYGNMVIENESEDHGGGIYFEETGPVDLYGNTFLRNSNFDDGGAISFEDVGDNISLVKIHDNLIAQNYIDDRGENTGRGGGLSFDDTFRVEVYNNIIAGNVAAGSDGAAGGGIDAERNGHEYADKLPGFSDPVIRNNIIWKNWRLEYTQTLGVGEENMGVTMGQDLTWFEDNIHNDDGNVLNEWENSLDAQTLTSVYQNIISAGDMDYYDPAKGNTSVDPQFMDPAAMDYRLAPGSPGADKAPKYLLRIPMSVFGKSFPVPPTP